MVSLRNVSKNFGNNEAVKDISFNVSEGQHFILLGTSGCGKTTTLRLINRLIEVSSGSIFIDGKDIAKEQPELLRRKMGYVLQRNSLFPHYSVAQNIAVVPDLLKWDKDKTLKRTHELLQQLHLPESYLRKYPQELSGGEAQRVNLARALVADPSILLMDEPFSALDTITRTTIRKEFQELNAYAKKTIIMVTHDVQEAFEMGDIICLMDKGAIMQVGTPAELLFHPANDFVRQFLSDAFLQLSFTITKLNDIWHYLPQEQTPEMVAHIDIQSSDSIWKAFELMPDKNDKTLRLNVYNDVMKEQKQISWNGLLSAFSSYQTTR